MKELNFTQEDGFYVAEVETNGEPTAIQVNRKYRPYPHDYSLEVLGRIDPSMPWAPVQMFDYKSPRNIIVYQNIPIHGYQLKLRSRTEVESACSSSKSNINYFYATNIGEGVAEICYYNDQRLGKKPYIEFSNDKEEWESFFLKYDDWSENYISLDPGETVYFRGLNPNGIGGISFEDDFADPLSYFVFDGNFEVGGDLNTLTNNVGGDCDLAPYHYAGILSNRYEVGEIYNARKLILPKNVNSSYALAFLFYRQYSLNQAPVIDVDFTNTHDGCLDGMFFDCYEINRLIVTFKNWPESDEGIDYFGWFSEYPKGVFFCPPELPLIFDNYHIPSGWHVRFIDTDFDFLLPAQESWPNVKDFYYYNYYRFIDDTRYTRLFCPIITKDQSIVSASIKLILDGNEYEPSEENQANELTTDFVDDLADEFGNHIEWLYSFADIGYSIVEFQCLDDNMPELEEGNHTIQVKIGDKYTNEITFFYVKPS